MWSGTVLSTLNVFAQEGEEKKRGEIRGKGWRRSKLAALIYSLLSPRNFSLSCSCSLPCSKTQRRKKYYMLNEKPGARCGTEDSLPLISSNVCNNCMLKSAPGDFPGSPVVKTLCFQCMGCRFYPWSGTMIPQAHGMAKIKKLIINK